MHENPFGTYTRLVAPWRRTFERRMMDKLIVAHFCANVSRVLSRACYDVEHAWQVSPYPACLKLFSQQDRAERSFGRGLQTTELPAGIATPTLRVIMAMCEFQGVIAATTPCGWRTVTMR